MKTFKISSSLWSIIFIIGGLFIWFRKTDGSGATNNLANQLISLGLWVVLFIIILIGHLIWFFVLSKKKSE